MTIELLAFWSLVVWRLTVLLVYDGITAGLRDRIGVKYNDYSEAYGTNIVATALTCHRCTSVWVAMAAMLFIQPAPKDIIPMVLALSGGSIVTNKIVMGE